MYLILTLSQCPHGHTCCCRPRTWNLITHTPALLELCLKLVFCPSAISQQAYTPSAKNWLSFSYGRRDLEMYSPNSVDHPRHPPPPPASSWLYWKEDQISEGNKRFVGALFSSAAWPIMEEVKRGWVSPSWVLCNSCLHLSFLRAESLREWATDQRVESSLSQGNSWTAVTATPESGRLA